MKLRRQRTYHKEQVANQPTPPLNVKALVGALNQEKALERVVIVQLC